MKDKELLELVARIINVNAFCDVMGNDSGEEKAKRRAMRKAKDVIDTMRANGYVHIDELTERAEKKIREEDNLYNNTGGKCGDSLSYHR